MKIITSNKIIKLYIYGFCGYWFLGWGCIFLELGRQLQTYPLSSDVVEKYNSHFLYAFIISFLEVFRVSFIFCLLKIHHDTPVLKKIFFFPSYSALNRFFSLRFGKFLVIITQRICPLPLNYFFLDSHLSWLFSFSFRIYLI